METNNKPYILWRRVSTKQQNDSGLGLDAQKSIAEYFMHREPEKVFTDVYSGTKLSKCPNLQKAIKYCKEKGFMLVIAKTDRFRNVQEALGILDEMGEGNLCFCDLPTTDRTVLTLMFAIWERQALMGRINTKRALDERRKQLEKDGYWISKSGNVCTHFGRPKGCCTSESSAASAIAKQNAAILWREQSSAIKFALRKRAEGWLLREIVEELSLLYDDEQRKIDAGVADAPNPYATPKGHKPSNGTVSRWLKECNYNNPTK